MNSIDKYWDKFYSDGKVESYLSYKQNQYKQDAYQNGTNTVNDGLLNNQRKEHG